ncbi:MAG: DUF3082 domain-containing protein [Elainellaceae cyanobacterium]
MSSPEPSSSQVRSSQASSSQSADAKTPAQPPQPTSPWRCFGGFLIAGPMAYAFYWMTVSIAQTLADSPIRSDSTLAANIAVLVRTLVIGMVALATGIFALVAVGLLALGIQLLLKRPQDA